MGEKISKLKPAEFDQRKHGHGLEEIARLDGSKRYYLDVLAALQNNQAFLFDSKDGFVVLKPKVKNKSLICLVWCAWSKSGNAISKYQSQIEEISIYVGAKDLEFWTKRPGFKRVAPKFNYQLINHEDGYDIWSKTL